MAIESDLDLMLRVRDGDAASFEILLRRYRLPLVSYFRRMVRDQGLAEDLAQEVFLRVYKSRERYQPEARFTTWLYRIATNLALNAIRDRKDEVSGTPDDDSDGGPASGTVRGSPARRWSSELMQSDRERLIRQAVEALPENQRAAVILHKYQEVDYRQIAGILSVSESAVKSLLFRAYETLASAPGAAAPGGSDMKCLETEKLISYAYRLMDEPAASEVRAHLGECSRCREIVEQYGRLDAVLDEWKAAEPTPEFDARVRQAVEAQQAGARGVGVLELGMGPRPGAGFAWRLDHRRSGLVHPEPSPGFELRRGCDARPPSTERPRRLPRRWRACMPPASRPNSTRDGGSSMRPNLNSAGAVIERRQRYPSVGRL